MNETHSQENRGLFDHRCILSIRFSRFSNYSS